MEQEFVPVLPHFAHQAPIYLRSRTKRFWGLLMDPGTGKTKVCIDTLCYLFVNRKVRGLLLLAPNEVDEQWVQQELPKHVPPSIKYRALCWESSSAKRQREVTQLTLRAKNNDAELFVLCMNHEAVRTKKGFSAARAFLKAAPMMFAVDESHLGFKNPKALQTKALQTLRDFAYVRRILTGTPQTQTPFDLYAQFQFLHPDIVGYEKSFVAFTRHYGEYTREFTRYVDKRDGQQKTREYFALRSYRNIEELYERVGKYSSSATKASLNLPPKVYSIVPVRMTSEQRALYDAVCDESVVLLQKAERGLPVAPVDVGLMGEEELVAALQSSSNRVTMSIKLTLVLRLQQIVGGFITDDKKHSRAINPYDECPRMVRTVQLVEAALAANESVIVWAQFVNELSALHEILSARALPSALIYGATPKPMRNDVLMRFKRKDPSARVLVAHPRTCGTGQDLSVAQTMIFYSNGYSYANRTQCEDRAHRAGQTGTVNVYDLRATGAGIELQIAQALQEHSTMAQRFKDFTSATLKGAL